MNLVLYFFLLSILNFSPAKEPKHKWIVTGSSKLEIQGSTNINKFRCLSTKYHGGDTLVESVSKHTGKFLEGHIVLRTSNFDCEHALITRDLKKTLKAETYPEVRIKFLQLKENKERKSYSGFMEITIAGISKTYPVTCAVQDESPDGKYLVGTNHFELSDFKLDLPEKFFGTIKVSNKVSVNFHLQLKAV